MFRRPALLACAATLTLLAACGGGGSGSDSGLNPLRWFGGSRDTGPQTLTPAGGYESADGRAAVGRVLSARWERTNEGRLLVVTALADTQGWWDVAIIPETAQPAGRLRADADGVLRLRLVGSPPPAGSTEAARAARPGVDTITAALSLTTTELSRIDQIAIAGRDNGVTLRP